MPVHPLRLPDDVEPGDWAGERAIDRQGHLIPVFPKSERFVLIAVANHGGPPGQGDTKALWVTTPQEMDAFLSIHVLGRVKKQVLWFTMAKHHVTDDMIECTLTYREPIS
jgi:hypothetical protein